jgi:hypothetical protein
MKEFAMNHAMMNFGQQYLPEGQAVRLPAGADRVIQVTAGRVWLTRTAADARQAPGDCWLLPGDQVLLRAGDDAVLEGWPSATYRLQPARVKRFSPSGVMQWLQALAAPAARHPAGGPCASPCASR